MWRPDINVADSFFSKILPYINTKWPSGLGNPQRRCRFGEPLCLETPKHRKLWINTAYSGIRGVAS